ncbi:MAG TPA: MurR/RpiR family transcriptional regulator [Verrucomicrobiae bacterium]|jgi:RpiR family carbohydrate utilization transcriptional regulator|nr:MurR/RpiR family transcriptional regulator [Verrucomicrobiae bacterium]
MTQARPSTHDGDPGAGRADSPELSKRPVLVYLQAILPSLNPVERVIAQYLLDDPERILSSSIAELRRGSGASVGSIIGFCRSLGAKGFADFKITLARELSQVGLSASQRAGQKNASIFENVFEFQSQSLKETLQLNTSEDLEKVSRALELARRIEFFSIGMSYPVAYTACAKLKLIGLRASAECDSHMQMINATQLRKGDVAFGISCSGSTTETVRCLEIARQGKATTLCVTNCMKSPITAQADMVLYATPSEIKYFQAPLASRITQLALVDALFVSIALRRKNRTLAQLQSAGIKLLEHRI